MYLTQFQIIYAFCILMRLKMFSIYNVGIINENYTGRTVSVEFLSSCSKISQFLWLIISCNKDFSEKH